MPASVKRKFPGDDAGILPKKPASTDDAGSSTVELVIPANKVGLVIGKGGWNIKQLQAKSGCKMVISHDGHWQNAPGRPLEVTGNPNQIEKARSLVQELIASEGIKSFGSGGSYMIGYGDTSHLESERPGGMGGPGGHRGPWPPGGAPPGNAPLSPDEIGRGKLGVQDQTCMSVPADKCGIVIGKGGETIHSICKISGAHVELNRNAPPGPDKEFTIRGTPEQIRHAMHLIGKKINVPPRGPGGRGAPAPGGWGGSQQGGPYNGVPGQWNGPHPGPGGYGGPQQQQQQLQQPNWGHFSYNQWGPVGTVVNSHSNCKVVEELIGTAANRCFCSTIHAFSSQARPSQTYQAQASTSSTTQQ